MAILNVLMIVVFLSILVLQFHQNSLHMKRMAHRYEVDETTRMVAESAMEEAYGWLFQETANPDSPTGQWLLRHDKNTPLLVPLSMMNSQLPGLGRSTSALVLKAEARIIDLRTKDWEARDYREGQMDGTFELKVSLTGKKGFFSNSKPFAFSLTHNYGFAIMTMISPRDNTRQRTQYSHCFPLDYALLVRNGVTEFRGTDGYSLNHGNVKCTVVQPSQPEKRGKVYFGGSDPTKPSTASPNETPKQNIVFLNMPEKFQALIPKPTLATSVVGQDVCLQMYPVLRKMISDEDVSLSGLRGIFQISTEPLPKKVYETEGEKLEETTIKLLQGLSPGAESNVEPGLEIIASSPGGLCDEAFVRSIIEGEIRQRFLYLVQFYLDLSGAKVTKKVAFVKKSQSLSSYAPGMASLKNHMYCIPNSPQFIQTPEGKSFFGTLEKLSNGPQLLTSRFDTSFRPFQYSRPVDFSQATAAAGIPFEQPKFFNFLHQEVEAGSTGWEGFGPYRFYQFWNPRNLSANNLVRYGVIDPVRKLIHLRGIVHLETDVTLGAVGEVWKVDGRGVLFAKNIHILGSILKNRVDDLCVLFTNSGSIYVDTEQPIEAVLMSIQHKFGNGSIVPSGKVQLKGALITDQLAFRRGVTGKDLTIEYDPALKTSRPVYSIVLIPIPTFRRYSEEQGDATIQ